MPRATRVTLLGWILSSCVAFLAGLILRSLPVHRLRVRFGRSGRAPWQRFADEDEREHAFTMRDIPRDVLALAEDPYVASPVPRDAPLADRPFAMREHVPKTGDRAVVAEARVRLVVTEVEETAARLEQIAREADGYVVALDVATERTHPHGRAVLAVPVERVAPVIERIRSLPVVRTVVDSSYREQDVTSDVLDLEARLTAARRTEERYLALLERAERVSDMVRIEEELRRIRAEIERLEGQQRWFAERRRMARIDVVFHSGEATLWQKLGDAFGEGMRDGLHTLISLARFAGRCLAIAGPFALLLTAFGWLLRRVPVARWQGHGTAQSSPSGLGDETGRLDE